MLLSCLFFYVKLLVVTLEKTTAWLVEAKMVKKIQDDSLLFKLLD